MILGVLDNGYNLNPLASTDRKMKENNSNKLNTGESSAKTFSINSSEDLIEIRDFGRNMAEHIGFEGKDRTLIATAISEICRNVIEYAGSGEVQIKRECGKNPGGIVIKISDNGPGIENINLALQEGYSTGKGLGVGLPGAKRIMDEFEIHSEVGKGTTVVMSKWHDQYGI